jgi:hypothetical protein
MKLTHVLTSAAAFALVASTAGAATNLVTNGDFQAGNSGFSSDYTFTVGTLYDPAVYNVGPNPNDTHGSWASFYDHTLGNADGEMMIVNGDATDSTRVWYQSIGLVSGQSYLFDFFMRSTYDTSPAVLSLSVAGTEVAGPFNAGLISDGWLHYTGNFTAGATGSAEVAIWNKNTDFTGNDFALDDISLAAVPEPATWAMMLTGFFGMGSMLRRRRAALAAA